MPPLLGDVFCQCRAGVDPGGGGGGHTEDGSSASPSIPVTRQPVAGAGDPEPGPGESDHPCDICGGPEQEHRLKVLFQVLDVNGDGGICVNDLTIGLKKLGVHRTEHELMVGEQTDTVLGSACLSFSMSCCPPVSKH